MEVHLLNSSFDVIAILDKFTSLIWLDRYWSAGDIDLELVPRGLVSNDLTSMQYLRLKESDHIMIVEYYNLHSDVTDGDVLIIKGRSLESILDRRVVWTPLDLTGSFQDGIQTILDQNIINPADTDRAISNFIFTPSTDHAITGLGIDNQFHGENLLTLISTLCQTKNIGFKVTLTSTFEFEFQLYAGTDRSFDQTETTYVVFSPNHDNLLNSDYVATDQFLKTVALVAGEEGVGNVKITVPVDALTGPKTGIERREIYFESGITRNTPDGELTEEEYVKRLTGAGRDELAQNVAVELFDGEVTAYPYVFGTHYNMGDIVQVADLHGHKSKSRITEMLYAQNASGQKLFPTFSKLAHSDVLIANDIFFGAIEIEAPTLG